MSSIAPHRTPVFDVDELHRQGIGCNRLRDDAGVCEEVGPVSDLIGWVLALGLVAALWGAAYWFAADTRDGRDWHPRDDLPD
jgi:hypothetical protein